MRKGTYPSSESTKLALADALKELMAQKTFDKITIHELTDRCGIRRQNFYYHFDDVYDLLQWTIKREAVSLLAGYEGELLWQEGVLKLFHYLEENRAFCLCALNSIGNKHLKRFFYDDIYAIVNKTVKRMGECSGAFAPRGVDSSCQAAGGYYDPELMTHIFVTSIAGIAENYLLGDIDRVPEDIVAFIDLLLQDFARGTAMRMHIDPANIKS